MHPVHRKVSLHYSGVDKLEEKCLQSILEGRLDNLPPLSAKLVRVFISSTFSDMIQERNALMEHIYYKLKKFCLEKYRLEFQMMDLRWGLREESQDNHTIIEFCIKEIENCRHLSIGPNFVAFLGQKYGYRSFPSTIESGEFETMREALLQNGKDINCLITWFKKDTNVIPNAYVLQPISSIIKNYNKGDDQQQEQSRKEWDKIFLHLQHVLRLGVLLCVEKGLMTLKEKEKYFISVTEYEIEKGMLESPSPRDTSLCFTRNITNLEENLSNKRVGKFLDISPDSGEVDRDAQKMLFNLKSEKIRPLLGQTPNMEHFEVAWEDPEEKNPNENEEYLQRFCRAFEYKIKMLVDQAMRHLKHISRNPQVIEIHQHLNMCRIRSKVFKGREAIIKNLRYYLSSPSGFPLILYGLSGSGKTSVLAKCASLIPFWFPNATPSVIVRFLGTTSHSCSIRLVLYNLCWHISLLLDDDPSEIPGDYSSLVKYFHEIILKMSPDKTVVIILDSIDQLSQAHKAHNLAWLPKSLPPNVYIILSTLSYEHDLLENLKVLYDGKSTFIEIEQLGTDLGISLIQEWMKSANRDLTDQQFYVVNEALSKCSLPLYTRLVFEEICRWSSFTSLEMTALKPSVKEIINKLLDTIEKYHGKVFVKHTLSYLTASKNGLSDVELEDVLSLDDDVLNDVFEHWLPPVRRIPPLLIPRLHDALSSYLMEREANGIIVYYWYHRQFIFVARERYLIDVGHKLYIHSTLAHYFQGTWGGGKTKPYKCTAQLQKLMSTKRKESDQADRKVPLQPLWYAEVNDRPKFNFNLRKLSELPYHLIESRRFIDLHSEVLFNYSWLHSKLTAMSLHDVLSDFRSAIEAGDADSGVSLVFNALRIGGSYVNSNPDTLAFDLLGRLLVYYDDNHLGIKSLLQQCDEKSVSHSALLPLHQCFDPPKAMLLYLLEDHSQLVVDLLFTPFELVSISLDGTIAFWDVCSGECTRTVTNTDSLFGQNTKLYVSTNCKYLVVDCDTTNSPVYIYDFKTCQLLHVSGRRLATQRRGFLSGNILCRQKHFINIQTNETVRSIENFVQSKRYVVCSLTPNQRFILIGDDFHSKLFDFNTCALLATFPASHMPNTVVITDNSSLAYVGYMETCLFKVLDIDPESKNFGTTVREFNYKTMTGSRFLDGVAQHCALNEIAISPIDDFVVVLNVRRCNLILYHTQSAFAPATFDMKAIHATNETSLFNVTFSYNALLVLASDKNFIHIWDVKTRLVLNSITLHSSSGFPWVVSKSHNIVATASNIHTAINIWDLNKIMFKETNNVAVYEGPVDMLACAPAARLAFVRKVVATNKSYKFMDSFGIDVWNVSTGSKGTFLNFDRYGKLEKLEVSPDGHLVALLVCTKETYVVVYNSKSGKNVCTIDRPFCKSFVISHNWELICIHCIEEEVDCTYMFSIKDGGKEIFKFEQAKCAAFTADGKYLLCIDLSKKILVYCLTRMAPVRFISCSPLNIIPLPVKHRLTLVNKAEPSQTAEIWDFHECKIVSVLRDTSRNGILDVSKNGKYAADGLLQIFDLESGDVVAHFYDDELGVAKEYNLVRLTHDGEYLVWIDEFSIKVGSVSRGNAVIASTCTHERPVTLEVLDNGYVVLLGREDGRFLMMKLVPHMGEFKPVTASGRAELLLDCETGSFAGVDYAFKHAPVSTKDGDLPKAPEALRSLMMQKSKKPHLVSMGSQGSLPRSKHKRTSSSANVGSPDSRDLAMKHLLASPLSDVVPGPTFNAREVAPSTSSADVFSENMDSSDECSLNGSPFFNQRSKSMQDILSTAAKTGDSSLDQSFENLDLNHAQTSPRKPKGNKIFAFFGKVRGHKKKPHNPQP